MAPRRDWCLPYTLVLLSQLHNAVLVSATTTVLFYTDASCKNLFATIKTDTDAGNGQCGVFATSINSASSAFVNNGCTVTTYEGPSTEFCSNNATLVPASLCTSMSIASYSVDCLGVNGTNEDIYTTVLAGDSARSRTTAIGSGFSTSTSKSTTPAPLMSSSPQDSAATASELATFPTASSSPPATLTSSSSSFPSLLREPSSSPSPPSQPTTAPTPSSSSSLSSPIATPTPSPSPSSKNTGTGTNGNDGGLSGPSTIAIGVVLPGVAVVVAVFFGVLGIKRWKGGGDGGRVKGDGEG